MSTTSLLLSAAILIVAVLAGYAWHLTHKVKQLEKKRQQEEAAAALQLRERQQSLLHDIRFIARSVIEEQCEITEGVLRLQYLITALDPAVWELDELQTVRRHHQATASMPILDAYRQLSRKEQFHIDKQRFALEEEHRVSVGRELRWLVTYSFPGVTLIQ